VLSLAHEMTAKQLGYRTLATASKVPLFVMRRGNLSMHDSDRLILARKELRGLPFHIDDTNGQTPRQIAATIRAAKRQHGIKLVMLDHLNLVVPDEGEGRHGPTHNTTMASHAVLKAAKDNDVAFLELVQLSRALENREDRRPALADLRQAGAIEEDCSAAMFVYREEMYLKNKPEKSPDEKGDKFEARLLDWNARVERSAGKAELIWGKIRDGETGTDFLQFHGPTTAFSDI
jgi:replicative DNA helicase